MELREFHSGVPPHQVPHGLVGGFHRRMLCRRRAPVTAISRLLWQLSDVQSCRPFQRRLWLSEMVLRVSPN
ncbi:hypothetical protein KC19_3G201000 [Ceratodon purpureus]|uniref:Uncharacterized protein n=1 Tax=Ceratodon purpureus TaxID=3225 RepID=A0A8T0IN90_CERPU|nr:hypothetical protein KC19_3G201000 [Ceratodon purpureus]